MLQVTQIGEHSFHAVNNDVKNCEAIVFAESVRSGRTILQVLHYVLEEDDSDTNLLCACETLQEEIYKAYKQKIIAEYLDNLLYENNK
jgi:HEAT repeat protein